MPRGGNCCDFCGTLFVFALYPCNNFKWEDADIFTKDTGHWATCETCSGLIRANAWAGLVSRVMRQVKRRAGITPREVTALRKDLQLLYEAVRVHIIPGMALGVSQLHYSRASGS